MPRREAGGPRPRSPPGGGFDQRAWLGLTAEVSAPTYLFRSVDSHTLTTLMTSLTVLRKSCILAATRSAGGGTTGIRNRNGCVAAQHSGR